MLIQHEFLPLFEKFIKDSRSGKRLNKNGSRIKLQSVANHNYCYKLLKEFADLKQFLLIVYQLRGNDKREHYRLKKYYSDFYKSFTRFLYRDKRCHDNYVGHTIKQIRTFYGWLNNDRGIITGLYYKNLYVCKEDVPIITLSVSRIRFLAFDHDFESKLSASLKRSKDIFLFGCIVGLRFGDLLSIKLSNIENREGQYYLKVKSQKTGTDTLVKLPDYAVGILNKYNKSGKLFLYPSASSIICNKKSFLLPSISLSRFNINLKKIAKLAGWTEAIEKHKSCSGIIKEASSSGHVAFRFCDVMSSHMMRRTSITIMLTSGMPEYIVRKISGHTSDSKAFFRYVDLAQSLMDKEIDKMHSHFAEN